MSDARRGDSTMTSQLLSIPGPRPPVVARIPAPEPASGHPGWFSRWLPVASTAAAIITMLLVVGTSPLDLVRYGAYMVWCLIVPGTLIYRALRRTPHSLVDDIALGTAVGLALEIAAWAGLSSLDAQRLLWWWPLAVIVPFAAVPALRRHWRTPAGYRRPSPGWSWAIGAVIVFAIGYIVVGVLWNGTPVPAERGVWYHRDDVYLLGLVAEAKLHFPVEASTVAGQTMHYHLFAYIHMASASLVSGIDTPILFYQLALPEFVALGALLLAVAGWRVSGRPWGGALAAALMFVVGEFTFAFRSMSSVGAVFAYYAYSSPSQVFCWIFAFALLAVLGGLLFGDRLLKDRLLTDRLRDDRREWALVAILALAASGAKSTVLPVLLAGLGAAGLAELIRRRRVGHDLLAAVAILAAAQLFALVVLFRFENHGLIWSPLRLVPRTDSWSQQTLIYATSGLAYLLYMFPRLAGIPVLARLTGREWDRREYFLLGAFTSGWIAAVTLAHPGLSQNFFISTSFGFGAILSAMGFAALVDRHRLPSRVVAVIVLAVSVAAAGLYLMLRQVQQPGRLLKLIPVARDQAIVDFAVLVGVVGAVTVAVWLLVVRRRLRRGVGVAVALAAILLAGLPSLPTDARHLQQGKTRFWHAYVTPDQVSAARWLRDNSSPDDLVATNEHCVDGAHRIDEPCLSLSYWLWAYSERRQLVGSWSYTPRVTNEGAGNAFSVAFWDPQLLYDNDIVFTDPTAARVSTLRDKGVRWLVVNRDVGREPTSLAEFAGLRFERGQIAVYELAGAP